MIGRPKPAATITASPSSRSRALELQLACNVVGLLVEHRCHLYRNGACVVPCATVGRPDSHS